MYIRYLISSIVALYGALLATTGLLLTNHVFNGFYATEKVVLFVAILGAVLVHTIHREGQLMMRLYTQTKLRQATWGGIIFGIIGVAITELAQVDQPGGLTATNFVLALMSGIPLAGTGFLSVWAAESFLRSTEPVP